MYVTIISFNATTSFHLFLPLNNVPVPCFKTSQTPPSTASVAAVAVDAVSMKATSVRDRISEEASLDPQREEMDGGSAVSIRSTNIFPKTRRILDILVFGNYLVFGKHVL